jgi:hypothetical protein
MLIFKLVYHNSKASHVPAAEKGIITCRTLHGITSHAKYEMTPQPTVHAFSAQRFTPIIPTDRPRVWRGGKPYRREAIIIRALSVYQFDFLGNSPS